MFTKVDLENNSIEVEIFDSSIRIIIFKPIKKKLI